MAIIKRTQVRWPWQLDYNSVEPAVIKRIPVRWLGSPWLLLFLKALIQKLQD